MSPFASADFGNRCRDLIRGMYSRGYGAGQRWGFKEIRYHRPLVAAFLERLFPDGQFVLLIRDPVELCVSNLLTEWSLEHLLACGGGHDRGEFLRIVEDCLYAIFAIQENFSKIKMQSPEKCRSIQYEELIMAPDREMGKLFTFLNLPLESGVRERIEVVAGSIAGATDKTWNRDRGFLNEDEIRAACDSLLADITEDIRVNGIEVGRLLGRDGQGRYSFIVGELLLNEPFISAMF